MLVGSADTVGRALNRSAKSVLRTRVLSALVLASAGIAAIVYLPASGFAVLAAGVLSLGAWEWSRLIPTASPAGRGALSAAIALAFATIWTTVSPAHYSSIAMLGAACWLVSPVWMAHPEAGGSGSVGARTAKVLACFAALIPAWTSLVWLRSQEGGPWWVLGLLVVVWAADILAYFTGKRFGKTKLAPAISPGKTREGAGGALIGAAAYGAVVCLAFRPEWDWWAAALLAVAVAAVSILGDLLISLLKRQAQVKDSGTLIPGHGGILDRFDSTLAAAPVCVAGISLLWI